MVHTIARVLLSFLTLVLSTHAFYFPGLAPTNFCRQQVLDADKNSGCIVDVFVHVNKLDSNKTIIPYGYSSFDFCMLDEDTTRNRNMDPQENLGQVVFGERLRASPYEISFAENITNGKELCTKTYKRGNRDDEAKLNFLRERIHENYMHQFVIDNMPVTWCYILGSDKPYCSTKFPVGCFVSPEGVKHDACNLSNLLSEKGATYVFNHVHLVISYHKGSEQNKFTDGRIVRAQVLLATCKKFPCTAKSEPLKLPEPKVIDKDKPFRLTYSYSVEFIEMNSIQWASRWDYILNSSHHRSIQWFNAINSTLIVIFISAMLGIFFQRYLHGNITQFSQSKSSKHTWKEFYFKWSLVHGDVFRPPSAPMLLSACVGSGAQILCMTLTVLILSCIGVFCPPNRGGFTTGILVLFVLFGYIGGYVSARVYKMIGGQCWKSNALMTSLFVPGITFAVFYVLNLFLWGAGSSAVIPFTTLEALLCLWFGISLPLTLLGSFLGFRKAGAEWPVETNQIPCEIPKNNWLARPVPSSLMGGVLPFGCIFVQLFFILNSLWSHQIYYMPGLIMLTFLLMVLVCAETSVILCFIHLCAEDYRWWWRSFFSAGTTAFYLFIYSIHYFFYNTSITGTLSYLLYFGYTFIMVFLFFIATGTIGFLANLLFVRKLYSKAMLTKTMLIRTTIIYDTPGPCAEVQFKIIIQNN